jgi:PAS domain S-box-containing protein
LVIAEPSPSGVVLFSNVRPSSVVGRPLSELGLAVDIFHADGRPYAAADLPLHRSIATGEPVTDEFVHVGPDGRRRTVLCTASPVRDRHGRIIAVASIARDVTARESLERDRAYHASLLDNIEDAVVGTDPEFRLTVWNRGAERLYGYSAEEVLGRPARDVASYAGDRSRLELERELLDEDRTRVEITARRKDGTMVEVELVSVAVRDESGALTGYLGIHRDITERKRSEEDLREARRWSESILESIGDSFFAVDGEWRYTYLNERALATARQLLGPATTRDDLLGRSCWELFPVMRGTAFDREFHRAVRDHTSVAFEALSPTTDRWLEVRAYPSDGGLSVFSRDITDQKRAEEERDRRTREQALVAELGQRALAGEDVQSVMDGACEVVASALDLPSVGIAEVVDDGAGLRLRAGVGWREGAVGTAWGGPGRTSLVGYTLRVGEPVVSEDLAAERRFALSPFLQGYNPASAATVLIAGRHRPFGVLVGISLSRRSFAAEDVTFLQAVANVVSSAVERVESAKRLVEVRDAERRRIARDLHDEALQDLIGALSEATALGPPASEAEAADRVGRMVAALKRAGQHVRGAIYDLRLGVDEDRPFRELLRELVDVHQALTMRARVELDVHDAVPVTALGGRGTEILRLVSEALSNARRHSRAETIRVVASCQGDQLCVEVGDDGVGLEPATELTTSGTGIRGMRERADQLGGTLQILGRPGDGTTVRLMVALTEESKAAPRAARILLVEDHAAVRQAIAATFAREPGWDIVAQAASLAEARTLLEGVDIAVIDLGLPDGYGGDLIRELRAVNASAQALVLTASLDRAEIARAIESGAAGTLDKMSSLDEVVDTVRRLQAGETLLPLAEVVDLLRYAVRVRELERDDRDKLERLTPREREVLQALADGLNSQEVADFLHITLRTGRNHVANILMKLDVHSQLQAVMLALRYGVVKVR